ncbi:UDP-3-O-acylglucosamine N-acyltransferase [bacterium BMS3Abin04]|nr:UDP-3-O-acylglucosamine N-acyltransferase [bacterium BMS3Abin04]
MKLTVKKIAGIVDGKIIGNKYAEISNVARIDEAVKGDLTFLYLQNYAKYLTSTNATAVFVKHDQKKPNRDDLTYIEVDSPETAFLVIINTFLKPQFILNGIDSTASVDSSARLGTNVSLGKNVIISANCIIENNTTIFHNTVLMENVKVGSNTLIFPNVTIRENCVIGNRVIIHAGSVIGSDGFGYSPDKNGVYHKIPQIGNVILEDDVEIGSNVSIDRAAVGSTVIGKGVKLDNLVQIAHNVKIGDNTVISAQSGISGSTKIGKNCILAGQVGTVGHIELADGVIVGAQSGVSKSLKKPGKYFGYPAKEMGTTLRLESHIRNLPSYSERIKKLEIQIKELKNIINNQPTEDTK